MEVEAEAACDLTLDISPVSASISGSIMAQNSAVRLYTTNDFALQYEDAPQQAQPYDVSLALDILTGQRVQGYFYFPTKNNLLMRALLTPQTLIAVNMDSAAGTFSVEGDLVLRGGEIIYLNRNFYLREGRIVLDENETMFDPRITARAEIRERDDDGELVRITMSVNDQSLSNFAPTFSSSPPKSEQEMMLLLGQTALADLSGSENFGQVVVQSVSTAADYGLQMTMLRQIENSLRDFFKFDIFSVRMSFLQNITNLVLQLNTTGKTIGPGNFFDNSTVYIGKYLGNALYADWLFHIAYDESRVQGAAGQNDISALVFQQELGLEMDSPFATIRWSLAPEIDSDFGFMKNLLVPYASISLSWKFVF